MSSQIFISSSSWTSANTHKKLKIKKGRRKGRKKEQNRAGLFPKGLGLERGTSVTVRRA